MAVGALTSGCIELPDKRFSCTQDGDCEGIGSEGEAYVCREKVCVLPGSGGDPDGGLDGGADSGTDAGPDGGTDGGPDAGPVACEQDPALMPCNVGWCWDNPLAAGSRLFAIRGRTENDIWAVGADGVALHWDGACWSRRRLGTRFQDLRGLWPAAGNTWRVVGINGTLLTWDGSGWTDGTLGTPTLHDISGGADGTAFAVGEKGTVQFFDGASWSAQDAGTSSTLTAVWTVSRSEAWAFAEDGGIFHGVDGGWSLDSPLPARPVAYKGAVGLPGGGVVAVGMGSIVRREGTMWTQSDVTPLTTPLNGVWHDSGRTWIVGDKVYLLDGGTEPSGTSRVLNSVWSRGERAWAVGESSVIVQRTGSQWAEAPGGATRTVRGLWSSPDGLWAVGEGGLIMRRVGDVWNPVPPPAVTNFRAIWGSGNLLMVLGDGGKVYVYRDGGWRTEEPGGNLSALWGLGPEQVWVVGAGGEIQRRQSDGGWVPETSTDGISVSLSAIWGSSVTNLWTVGSAGSVYRREPQCTSATCNWVKQTLPPAATSEFTGVWGTDSGKVWVVASGGDIYHYDGGTWAPQPINGGNPGLSAISGRGETEAWAVGNNGSVATWDGNNWTLRIVATGRGLMTILVTEDAVWAGGRDGTIFRKQ